MARHHNRRTLRLERLENREVLSGPTAEQAYMLELVNLARTNPTKAAQEFTTNLDANVTTTLAYYHVDLSSVQNAIKSSPAQPPLAWNDQIAQAAQGQSQYQADAGVQSHTGAGGADLNTRLQNAGVDNIKSSGEDIYAYSTSPMEAMQAFMIDWGVANDGHRINIQQPGVSQGDAYQSAGVGLVKTSGTGSGVGPEVMTVDFASQSNAQAQLIGFAYNDPDHTGFYAPGQGQSGITIQATNVSTGATVSTQTQSAGYYALSLAPGSYEVTATENGQVIQSQNVSISNVNVEIDYNLTQLAKSAPASSPTVTPAAQIVVTGATSSSSDSSSNSHSDSTPQPVTVTIPQNNTVTIPQASNNNSSSSNSISSIFNQMFGTGFQFSMTSFGAGS